MSELNLRRTLLTPAAFVTLAVLAVLVVLPFLLTDFWTTNIFVRAMVYGIVALSLTFLAHYGGLLSLAQMVVAGVAGYTIAVTVPEAIPANALQLPYALAIPLALLLSTSAGLLVGAIAVRTREIYLLMITLAIAVSFYFFVQANVEYLNGYEGIRNVLGPSVFGVPIRTPTLFYYVALVSSAALYAFVLYISRAQFGLVLQGIRDNPRRVSALGYNVALHRIAAFGIAGFIAGIGGVLITIYNIGISPGTVSTHSTISILIMAVIGGLGHPIGAFIGAIIFTIVDTFAADLYDRDRFNTLIGAVFLIIVVASPDGITGLVQRAGNFARSVRAPKLAAAPTGHPIQVHARSKE
jgi:branched-chain amino acid transport system permease protein